MSKFPERRELEGVIARFSKEALQYLESVDDRPVLSPKSTEILNQFRGSLPEDGIGADQALDELYSRVDAVATTSGPRCFHFVIGGSTPASLGADLWASLTDQLAYAWVSSPLATSLETLSLEWLKDLFRLPAELSGVIVTGATMGNFIGLAAARQWWAEQHGVDVAEEGLSVLPPVPIIASGLIHPAAIKCISMLGIGRTNVNRLVRDDSGQVDLAAMELALQQLQGKPAIVVATVGEPNAGMFDPVNDIADLTEKYGAWLHVDGAFGLFANISPKTNHLTRGVERAQSIAVDGHKWLNVPYDCGFGFVRGRHYLSRAFAYSAAYLADDDEERPVYGTLSPQSSRRARSLSVWATLRAYGRSGYRKLVEQHLELAQHLGNLIDASPDFERLADIDLNVVCFRYNPGGFSESDLNKINHRLGEAIITDGRIYVGSTIFRGKAALRPAIANWRTRCEDVEMILTVARDLVVR